MNIGGFKATLDSDKAIQPVFDFLAMWNFSDSRCEVRIDAVGATQDYKSIFWIWMRHLAKSFSERGSQDYDCNELHDIVCHKFLGYEPARVIGRTKVKPALRTITYPKNLNKSEFYHFLREIEIWASDNGVVMPDKPSEYQKDKERETA